MYRYGNAHLQKTYYSKSHYMRHFLKKKLKSQSNEKPKKIHEFEFGRSQFPYVIGNSYSFTYHKDIH